MVEKHKPPVVRSRQDQVKVMLLVTFLFIIAVRLKVFAGENSLLHP